MSHFFKALQIWNIWAEICVLSEIYASKTRFKQINENLRPNALISSVAHTGSSTFSHI